MNTLDIVGRQNPLFEMDLAKHSQAIKTLVEGSRFLVLGGAGTIGQAVVKEIFKRDPQKLHVVDISENNLVELVRDIRSSFGYISGEFKTFALDIASVQYDAMINSDGQYDYVLNLSALKHVRSEKDPFTLMRMIDVNIFNTQKTLQQSIAHGVKKYFCVSTDKAANPVNMMGASKRIMEMFLSKYQDQIAISTARFANVAFSDGSLLHGFNLRLKKRQPIVAPSDVRRYFVTEEESGILCLMSCLFGESGDVFFPKLDESENLITFSAIAERFLSAHNLIPHHCENEDEARDLISSLPDKGRWPCLFLPSDTTGEKDFEEFFMAGEQLDLETFDGVGIVKGIKNIEQNMLEYFEMEVAKLKAAGIWSTDELIELFNQLLTEFNHKSTGRYLDSKM